MNQASLLADLAEIMELPAEALSPAAELAALPQWDSTAIIGFMAACDERYGRLLPTDRLLACRTVGDLLALAEES